MKNNALIASIFLLLPFLSVTGQSMYEQNIIIPDPQIWTFMKYGGGLPNLYTGTINVNIPIYTYKDADFEIPISINYASNGYMPNIPANYVGLGWYLDAGGSVTREVGTIRDNCTFHNNSDALI